MDKDQFIKTVVMPLLAGLGGWLVGSGKLTSDQWGQIVNLLLNYGPGILTAAVGAYAWLRSRPAARVLDAKSIPGVSVKVDPATAPQAVVELAKDPTVSKVNTN